MATPPESDVKEVSTTTLNIALNDEVADKAREIKKELGLTWSGFIKEGTKEMDDSDASQGAGVWKHTE